MYLNTFFAAPFALVLCACSNVVTPDGGGGAGASGQQTGQGPMVQSGSGTHSGSESTTGSGGGDTSSASTGQDPNLCDDFCSAVGTCYSNCHTACGFYQAAPCQSEGAAYVACLISNLNPNTCQLSQCEGEKAALGTCRTPNPQNCTEGGCAGTGNACSCNGLCAGGEELANCIEQNGIVSCSCYLNGLYFASCFQNAAVPSAGLYNCDLQKSCCGLYFGT